MDWQAEVRVLLQKGEKARALQRVMAHLRAHPRDVTALLWFAGLTEDRERAIAALRYVLRLDPENAAARKGLAALGVALAEEGEGGVAKEALQGRDGAAEEEGLATRSGEMAAKAIRIAKEEGKDGGKEKEAGKAKETKEQGLRIANTEDEERGQDVRIAKKEEPRHHDEKVRVQTQKVQEAHRAAVPAGEKPIRGHQILRRARATIWPFQGHNRPLGALVDAGVVKAKDLEWAARKARQPEIRWAAAVLLRATELQDISLTEQQAAKEVFPFRRLNRPLGVLLREGSIELRDLAYAVHKAYAPHLRQAAAVMGYVVLERQGRQSPASGGQNPKVRRAAEAPAEPSASDAPAKGALGASRRPSRAPQRGEDPQQPTPSGRRPPNNGEKSQKGPEAPSSHQSSAVVISSTAPSAPTAPPRVARKDAGDAPHGPRVNSKPSSREKSSSARQPAPASSTPNEAQSSSQKKAQPSPHEAPGALRVYQGDLYLQRQVKVSERRLNMALYALMGLLFAIAGASVIGGVYIVWRWHSRLWGNVAIWSGVVGLLLLSRATPLLERLKAQRNAYRQGLAGEERVLRLLRDRLGQHWRLYRNLKLPDGQGDLDAVLLGPRGLYVLEIKTYRGKHRVRGDEWYRKRWGKWMEIDANPTRQALGNAQRLANFLRTQGIAVWVEPRVVWAGQESPWIDGKPKVPLWDLNHEAWIWNDLRRGRVLPPETRQRIHEALRPLFALKPEAGS